jgi:hypothetical protein
MVEIYSNKIYIFLVVYSSFTHYCISTKTWKQARDIAQWFSVCLACMRHWVQSPAPQKKAIWKQPREKTTGLVSAIYPNTSVDEDKSRFLHMPWCHLPLYNYFNHIPPIMFSTEIYQLKKHSLSYAINNCYWYSTIQRLLLYLRKLF